MKSSPARQHANLSIVDIHQRLAGDVYDARRNYINDAAGRPGLGIPVVAHLRVRLRRSRLPVSLGESVPTIFGDLLQIRGQHANRYALAWMYLYHHSLLVDDLTDGHADSDTSNASTAAYLLDRALQLWSSCGGLTGSLVTAFERYYAEQMTAGAEPVGAVDSLGRRGALVKYFATVVTTETQGRLLSENEERGVESILAGFQLLDDVTDYEEDRPRDRADQDCPTREDAARDELRCVRVAGERSALLLNDGLGLIAAPDTSDLARFVGNYIDRIRDGLDRAARKEGDGQPLLPLASN